MPLSMPRWSGLTGSTTADCWNPSETFHQQNEKGRIIINWKSRVKLPDSNKPVSGITGAVQVFQSGVSGPNWFRFWFVGLVSIVFTVQVAAMIKLILQRRKGGLGGA